MLELLTDESVQFEGINQVTHPITLDDEIVSLSAIMLNKEYYQFLMLNRPEINNLIRFFFRSKGRLKPFYAPTWVNDLEITKDINASDDFLLITITDTYKYLNNKKGRIL